MFFSKTKLAWHLIGGKEHATGVRRCASGGVGRVCDIQYTKELTCVKNCGVDPDEVLVTSQSSACSQEHSKCSLFSSNSVYARFHLLSILENSNEEEVKIRISRDNFKSRRIPSAFWDLWRNLVFPFLMSLLREFMFFSGQMSLPIELTAKKELILLFLMAQNKIPCNQ